MEMKNYNKKLFGIAVYGQYNWHIHAIITVITFHCILLFPCNIFARSPYASAAYRELQCYTYGACGWGHYYTEYDCNFNKFPISGQCPDEGGVTTCGHIGTGTYTSYWPGYIYGYAWPVGDVRTVDMIVSGTCDPIELGGTTGDKGGPCSTPSIPMESHVNLKSGNLYHSQNIGPLTFSYNSIDSYNGSLGRKWFHNYESRIWITNNKIAFKDHDGNIIYFKKHADIFYPEDRSGHTSYIIKNTDGTFSRITKERTTYIYQSNGMLISIFDKNGNKTALNYTDNYLSSITDIYSRTTNITYVNGKIAKIIDSAGNEYILTYAGDYLDTILNPDGNSWTYKYDNSGRMLSKKDPAGKVSSYAYDEKGRLSYSQDAEGNQRIMDYVGSGVSVLTDKDGGVWRYTYDPLLAVTTSTTDPLGNTASYAYNSKRQRVKVINPNGISADSSYDERGNRLSETAAVGTPLARTTSFTYTAENQLATRSEPSGSNPGQQVVTSFSYDERGNLTALTRRGYAGAEAIVESWGYSYDGLGRLVQVDGPRGDVEDILRLEYYPNEAGQGHNRGQLRAITNALGQTTVFGEYSALGKPGKITDASGLETSLSYNFRGDVLTRTTGNLRTSYSYDAAGRLLSLSLPGGRRLSYSYSGSKLASITDALGNAISYSYDSLGRQSGQELRDPENTLRYSLQLAYDQVGNLSKRLYADNAEEQFAYDPVANLVRAVDPLGVVSEYGYDALGRQLTEKRAGQTVATMAYDSQDNIIGVTDARSHVTTSVYDDFGRERKVVSPDAGTSASVYDEAGNLVSQTNALGERVELSWDVLNRPVRIQWPGAVRPVAFSWDQGMAGRLAAVQEEEIERHFSYTSLGQVAAESFSRDGAGFTLRYGYDEATGELSSITYPSGTVLRYSRDAAGRISGLRFGEHDLATAIRYLPFGPVQGMTLGGVNLSRSHDQRYQLSRIQAGSLDYSYSRNAAGQVTGIEGLATPVVASGSESSTIDASNNQLAVRGGTSYSYDAAGRLLSDGVRTFSWDSLGRLRQVEANAVVLASYGYDSQNRRVRKTVGAKTTYYLYDLENRLIAEISGDGTVLREYIWLENEPLALREYELRPGLYYYINDHLGAPQQLITADGTTVWQAAYLPFGEAQLRVGTVQNNLRFPGQYYDAETGLHYNWNRYYDPEIGRYISPDPIGLEGGMNLYAYVGNDPVNWMDPWGLTPAGTAIGGTVGGVLGGWGGSIIGGIAGGAGGTLALPGGGTIAGGITGAEIGGYTGAAGGVIAGAWIGDKISDLLSGPVEMAKGGKQNIDNEYVRKVQMTIPVDPCFYLRELYNQTCDTQERKKIKQAMKRYNCDHKNRFE